MASGGDLEVEWQFEAADLDKVAAWLDGGGPRGFRVEPRGTEQLRDRYFDTPGRAVYRAGYGARIRSTDRGHMLTLKTTADAVDGVRRRIEYSESVAGTTAEDALAASGEAGVLLRDAVGGAPMEELFVIATERMRYAIALAERREAPIGEVALDASTIERTGKVVGRMRRVEVEVVPGAEAVGRDFVREFVAALGLTEAVMSKIEAATTAAGLDPLARP